MKRYSKKNSFKNILYSGFFFEKRLVFIGDFIFNSQETVSVKGEILTSFKCRNKTSLLVFLQKKFFEVITNNAWGCRRDFINRKKIK